MTRQTLSDRLERLLQHDGVAQEMINNILSSLVLTQNDDLTKVQLEVRANKALLDEILREIRAMRSFQERHPSLLWMLRFKTRRTVTAIVLIFVGLNLWWVSGLRQPILKFLGLPVF